MLFHITITALVLNCFLIFAQSDESVVAQIGNEKLTAKEFKLRFELSPYIPSDKNIDPDSVKYDFLYSLIAEKLWAKEAEKLGIGNSKEFNFYFKPIEDLFVRDALFKQEVENKVKISQSDIEKGIFKSQLTQVIRFLSSEDSLSIFSLYNALLIKKDLDSSLIAFATISDTIAETKFGTIKSEILEDSIYSLKKGNYSSPFKIENGWIILFCKDQIFTLIDIGDSKMIENIKKVIRERKLEILYNNYRNNLLSGMYVKINPELFAIVNESIWEKLIIKNPVINNDKNYFELNEQEFENLMFELKPEILTSTLFTINKKKVLVSDFLSKLAYSGFSIEKLDSISVSLKLAFIGKRFVEEQILAEEGYKKGYNLLPQVKNDLNLWRQKYLAQMYLVSTLDSIVVDENMLYSFYNEGYLKAKSVSLVKLQMITITDLDEISIVLDKMNAGIDFTDIVKFYGKTDSILNSDGETGFLPVSLLGDLSEIVSRLNINEIFGPIKRSNGYTILKMIGKKEKTDSLFFNYDQLKDQLRSTLRLQKLSEMLNEKTIDLSIQQNVKIYNSVLDKITATNIPMFVHRFMGFGGRMAGIPLVTPFSGWINNISKKKLFP